MDENERTSNFETHGRITSGVLVHGAEHDAYILIAVIHRVGWPTSAALWVCPWEMAKTTCKESPRNKTTFESQPILKQPAMLFYANPKDAIRSLSPPSIYIQQPPSFLSISIFFSFLFVSFYPSRAAFPFSTPRRHLTSSPLISPESWTSLGSFVTYEEESEIDRYSRRETHQASPPRRSLQLRPRSNEFYRLA